MLGKILFVTSRFGGLPQGVINTLKRMNVDYIECPIWSMEEMAEKFQPQVMIFFHHFLKEFETYTGAVEKIQCHKIYWDWECPWEIDYLAKYHHLFGYIMVHDRSSARSLENRMSNKVIHVPHAADPQSCKHIDSVPFEYRSDLCFIGAAYPSRVDFFRKVLPELKDYKVVIGGTGWEFLPDATGQKIINNGVGDDYLKYICGAKINVNLHRRSQEVPIANDAKIEASSPNNRFFEVYMAGQFQLVDDAREPEIHEYYPDVPIFHSPAEFLVQFREWVKNDEGRRQHALEKQRLTQEKHTYEKRFVDIIAPLI